MIEAYAKIINLFCINIYYKYKHRHCILSDQRRISFKKFRGFLYLFELFSYLF